MRARSKRERGLGVALLMAGLALSVRCSSDGAGGDGSRMIGGDPTKPHVGGFTVTVQDATPSSCPGQDGMPALTQLLGKVFDGPVPVPTQWTLMEEAGGCQLMIPQVPFCDPPCASGSLCTANGQCTPFPKSQSVGTVHVEGLGPSKLELEPINASYTFPAGLQLGFPPFDEGAVVRVRAAGGAYDPFVLEGRGIAPLRLSGTGKFKLKPNEAFKLSWPPPRKAGETRMHLHLDISHHGGTKGKIECALPDTGSLEIPGPLVSKLIGLGVSGFPTVIVSRVSLARATIRPGNVALRVESTVERELEVPGSISCATNCTTGKLECPPGLTCQTDLTCK